VFDRPERAFTALGESLEAYQQTPVVFSPFSSKFEAFLRGQAGLTPRKRAACRHSTIRCAATASAALAAS
jgi:cytochrome c peroxidase